MLLVGQKYSIDPGYNVTNHAGTKLTYNGSAYTLQTSYLLNWATLGVAGAGYSVNFVPYHTYGSVMALFQYNPVSKRIYMMTSVGCLFIFKFNGTFPGGDSLYDWWISASPDETQLNFEKTVALGGIAGYTSDGFFTKFFVEYDTITGTEKSITVVNRFNTHWGSVTRIPWVE